MLAGFNDLAATHPGIAAMWHPRMNRRLKPAGVQAVSRKPAWWRGECGHVYQMAVSDRARARSGYCPYCSGRRRPERPIRLDWPSAPRRGRNGGRPASCGRSPTSTRPTATWSARTRPSTNSTCRVVTAPAHTSPVSRSGNSMVAKKFWLSGSYMRPISLEGAMSHVKSMLGALRIAWTA